MCGRCCVQPWLDLTLCWVYDGEGVCTLADKTSQLSAQAKKLAERAAMAEEEVGMMRRDAVETQSIKEVGFFFVGVGVVAAMALFCARSNKA